MTATAERPHDSEQPVEQDAPPPPHSAAWPERSHLTEFDAAIQSALQPPEGTTDPHPAPPSRTNPANSHHDS